MKVIVTGSLSYDYIMDFPGRFADRIMPDKIHNISLSFIADTLEKQFGGTAANVAFSLKLLGVEPTILATAGKDFSQFHTFLRKKHISTRAMKIYKDINTSSYFVITDRSGNQIGSFYAGAQKYAKKLSIGSFVKGQNLCIISPTDPEAMKKTVRECGQYNVPYFYDPAFQIATFSKEELKRGVEGATIVFGNDYEIALIEKKLEVSHEEMLAMGPAVVITTLGSRGSIIETRKESIHVTAAKPKAVVDPTGAGDAYRAGFIAGYLRGFDLKICGQMGAIAAVYVVEKYGTLPYPFTQKTFMKRFQENFGTMIAL